MSQDSSGGSEQPGAGSQPAENAPPPPPPPAAAPKKRRTWLTVTLVSAAVAAVVLVGGAYLLVNSLREGIPAVGECLSDAPNPDDMSEVGCDSDQAAWSVIGEHGTMTQQEFRALTPEDGLCQEHEGTEQALWVTDAWFVDDSSDGTVVCLRRVGGTPAPEPAASEPAESGSG